jgi:hypothetical protein
MGPHEDWEEKFGDVSPEIEPTTLIDDDWPDDPLTAFNESSLADGA